MDAQTRARDPSAEQPQIPERRPEQPPAPERDRKTGEKAQQADDKASSPSLRDRLREHWLLASVAACVLLVVLIGGIAYWLDVRHFEIDG